MKSKQKVLDSANRLSMLDFGVYIVGAISCSAVLTWVISGFPVRTETSDKLVYLLSGAVALACGILALRKPIPGFVLALFSIVSWISIFVGIIAIEHFNMSKEHPMGFGWQVAVLTVFFLWFVHMHIKNPLKYKKFILLLWVPSAVVIVLICLAWWQTSNSLIEVNHSTYVLNELLGPAAGYPTYQEFIPQYVYLLGWILKPVLVTLGPVAGINFLVLFLTFLGSVSILIMVFVSKYAAPKIAWPIIIIASLSFCTPTPGWNRTSFIGPASTLLSGPPIRIFGGMVLGLITILVAKNLILKRTSKFQVVSVGFVSSLVIWNNLDFGLAAALSSTIVIALSGFLSKFRQKLAFMYNLLGQLIGHLVVVIYLRAQNGLPEWNLFGWFARQFGGGFGAVTIEMPGAVNLAFPLIMGSASIGIYFLLSQNKFSNAELTSEARSNLISSVVATYFGLFSGFALPYYVNRSFHAGQLSMVYVPLATSLIASCSLLISNIKKNEIMNLRNGFPALILSFMMATVYLIPNPNIEIDRIRGGNIAGGVFPPATIAAVISEIPLAEKFAKENSKTISYYGEGGNYVHMVTGIESTNIFNSPLDLFQSDAAVRLSCQVLYDRGKDYLVLTPSAEQTFAWTDGSLCGGLYLKEAISGVGVLGVRKK